MKPASACCNHVTTSYALIEEGIADVREGRTKPFNPVEILARFRSAKTVPTRVFVRQVRYSDEVEKDFDASLVYMDEHSPRVLDQFVSELASVCQLLTAQPKNGRSRDDLLLGLRRKGVGKYVLFFQSTEDELFVLRIIHGSRDVESEFLASDL